MDATRSVLDLDNELDAIDEGVRGRMAFVTHVNASYVRVQLPEDIAMGGAPSPQWHPCTIKNVAVGTFGVLLPLRGGRFLFMPVGTDVSVPAGSIGTTELANDSVTAAKIANGAVGPTEIADRAVGPTRIELLGVQTDNIANGAVTRAKLATGAGVEVKNGGTTISALADTLDFSSEFNILEPTADYLQMYLRDNAVSGSRLIDNSVNGAKIANGTITANKMGEYVRFWSGSGGATTQSVAYTAATSANQTCAAGSWIFLMIGKVNGAGGSGAAASAWLLIRRSGSEVANGGASQTWEATVNTTHVVVRAINLTFASATAVNFDVYWSRVSGTMVQQAAEITVLGVKYS